MDVANLASIDQNFVSRLEKDSLKQINDEKLQKYESLLSHRNVELTRETQNYGAGVRWKKLPGQQFD